MVDILPTNQVIELLANDTSRTVVGYGFATMNQDAQQEQRWLLLPPYREIAPPKGTVHLRKAQNATWGAVQDMNAFTAASQSSWKTGANS